MPPEKHTSSSHRLPGWRHVAWTAGHGPRALGNTCAALVLLLSLALAATLLLRPASEPVHAATAPLSGRSGVNPDAVCAKCHAKIYEDYERTAMARGSGPAQEGFISGTFRHDPSGVEYRVFERDGSAWMSFTRPGSDPRGALSGERQLLEFVGSGHRGRTFLYQVDGQYFELPINYYTRQNGWNMAPAYDSARTMPAPLPVDPNCLHCHATDIAQPLPGARNRFAAAPFAQGGIGCSACHGDPSLHLAAAGRGPIVNPGKLSVPRRDSSCIQCHLEGDAVIYRPGRSLAQFRAGNDLSDDAVYFVRRSQASGGARATSQYEALLQSACKRSSGDRLTCTTCHDPHFSPSAADRVSYFRARCLSCHNTPELATKHHPEQPDCAVCHMPSLKTADISHEQVTDHNVERRPSPQSLAPRAEIASGEELVPVGNVSFGSRELGLAYAQLAQRGDRQAGERALKLLSEAERSGSNDEQLHLNLGFLEQLSGRTDDARTEYSAALKANPFNPAALTDLAVLEAGSGQAKESLELFEKLFHADPSQTAAGLDLAFLQCRLGHPEQARQTAERLREFNPDSPDLRAFTERGAYGGQSCPAVVNPQAAAR